MANVVVIDCVGLTPAHIGTHTPYLSALAGAGACLPLTGVVPAVTTTAQATMLTGQGVREHGIVGNGWYFRELGEVLFWRQSEKLVQAPALWQTARKQKPDLTVLKHFWWYALNSDATAVVTPRPAYHHDGRKSPDFYAAPSRLKDLLREKHGEFPLFHFWGPTSSIASTRWIAESFCTAYELLKPNLALCYLPHLDYDLQRFGPTGPHLEKNLRDLDREAGKVIDCAKAHGAEVVVVSEYGISAVDRAVFINRALREAGLLSVSVNATGELLDTGTSQAFAVCDHQVAHVYCKNAGAAVKAANVIGKLDGVERVYVNEQRAEIGLDHPRSGELVALAASNAWFTYDYWLEEKHRPDFARCVEIHKKPGYDPRELFFDPRGGKARAARALLRKKLGLRYVMDPIPLDTSLVKGSHGRPQKHPGDGPILISSDQSWNRSALGMLDIAPRLIEKLVHA
jgi:predicted AlkP superfamily pyrophosphatase or phosphodiesterase